MVHRTRLSWITAAAEEVHKFSSSKVVYDNAQDLVAMIAAMISFHRGIKGVLDVEGVFSHMEICLMLIN